MEDSLRTGFMAAFAVSGGVVCLAMHAHNRLLSDFFNKIEFQIQTSTGDLTDVPKKKMTKKVRFADDVAAAESTVDKAYVKKHGRRACRSKGEVLEAMPQNWQVLYKGILQHKNRI